MDVKLNMDVKIKVESLVTSVCNSCLIKGRRLSPLADYADLFMYLLGDQGFPVCPDGVLVCWECLAILKRTSKFQLRAQHAQNILQGIQNEDVPKPISGLTKVMLETINIPIDFYININNTNITIKKITKKESVDVQNGFNTFGSILKSEVDSTEEKPDVDYDYETYEDSIKEEFSEPIVKQKEKPIKKEKVSMKINPEYKKKVKKLVNSVANKSNNELCHEQFKLKYTKSIELQNGINFAPIIKGEVVSNVEKVRDIKEINYENEGVKMLEPLKNQNKKEKVSIALTDEKLILKRARVKRERVKRSLNPDVDIHNYKSCYEQVNLTESDIENSGFRFERENEGTQDKKKGYKQQYKRKRFIHCCDKEFLKCIDFRRHKTYCHILKEKSPGPFVCLQCGNKCINHELLRAHWEKMHNTVLQCKICGKHNRKSDTTFLIEHAKKHMYLWTCRLCIGLEAVFCSYRDYQKHNRAIHECCICDYCGNTSQTKEILARHMRAVQSAAEKSDPPARNCGSFLRKHAPLHCAICRIDFKTYGKLCRHRYSNHPAPVPAESTFCVECNKQFSSLKAYRHHLKATKVHNPAYAAAAGVPCPDCGKVFSRKNYLNNHYKLAHIKKTNYRCELCGKYLYSAWAKKIHIQRVHQKIKLPKTKICDICGTAFQSNAVLTKHIRTHTGERPYKCAHCPAAFAQSSALTSHTRTQHKQA